MLLSHRFFIRFLYFIYFYIGALRKGGTPQRARLASVVCLFVSGSNDNAGVASATSTSASKRRAGPGWSHLTQRMKASVSHRVCRAQCQPTGARLALKSRLRPSRPRPRLEPDESTHNQRCTVYLNLGPGVVTCLPPRPAILTH